MDDQELLAAEGSETKAKKEVARNFANSSDNPQEDPSRATLHYGDEERPELGGDAASEAIVPSAVAPMSESDQALVDAESKSNSSEPTQSSQAVQDAPKTADGSTGFSVESVRAAQNEVEQPASPAFVNQQSDKGITSTAFTSKSADKESNPLEAEAPINVAPTEVLLSGTEVSENAEGAVIGRLSVIDGNSDDAHSFSLSDPRFEVVDGEVRLRAGVALDHEEAATIQLEVTATDRGGLSTTETFEIVVQDVNEGPETLSLEGQAVAENTSGVLVGRLSVVDPDAGDSHTYAVSDDRFEVVDGALQLRAGVTLDFEEASSVTLEVTATDSGGLSVTEAFDVIVRDLNEGPEGVSLEYSPVAENSEGATIGHLSVVDPDADDTHSFTVSDDRFEVVDGEIRLKAGVALNFEEAATIALEVTAIDSGGLEKMESFEIVVLDENEGPTAISLDEQPIAENVSGAVVGRLEVVDPDAGDSHSYTVSDDRFEVTDGEVRLKPGVALDHEEAATITLEVTATDSGGASVSENFEIVVADLNEAPDSVALDGRTIIAGREGAVVGQVNGTDPDAGDTLTYTVSDERFEIVGGEVRLKAGESVSPDEETLEIVVTATDIDGLSISEAFEISVFDPPVISVESGFTADYFDVDGTIRRISDIDWDADPTHSEITQGIDYENGSGSFWEGGDTDTFGVRVNGNIEVEEGGSFTFHLGGDDGAVLFVNGEQVINNDGLHGYRTRTGEIELPEGNHHIEVHYFENYGHAGLRLEWEGPGIDGRQLVDSSNDGTAIGIEGVAISLNLDIDNVDEAAEIRLEGVPVGTIVQVGDTVLTAGEDETIDLTGFELAGISLTPAIGSAADFQPNLVVSQTGPNGDSIEVAHPIDIDVTPAHIAPSDVDLHGGFHASYFDVNHSLSRLDQIDWDGTPTHEEIVMDVNYENGRGSFWEGGSRDTFGARIEGEIEVTEAGTYNFFLGGDDGAMLLINGEPVIDNDGLHGFRTRNGEIDLEPGDYSIEVRYFENYGHAGLKLEWQGPGTDGRELVPAKPDLDIDQSGTAQFAIDLGDSDSIQSVSISGLPEDTVLFLGDETFVSDGSPIDVSGHDLSLMEISPPAGFVGMIQGEVSTESTAFNGQMTKSGTEFELSVGEDATMRSSTMKDDGSLIMMDGTQEEPDFPAWTQDDSSGESGENDSDDVMSEKVSDFQISESPEEQLDTYERYDW